MSDDSMPSLSNALERSPDIKEWLLSMDESALVDLGLPDLSALNVASMSGRFPTFPEEILMLWLRAIIRETTMVEQATLSFINEAKKSGWSIEEVATELRLGDSSRLASFIDEIQARITDRHPGNLSKRK